MSKVFQNLRTKYVKERDCENSRVNETRDCIKDRIYVYAVGVTRKGRKSLVTLHDTVGAKRLTFSRI